MKCYIDCGTHNGNSVLEFIQSTSIFIHRNDAKEYKIYAFEPNAYHYNLEEKLKDYNVTIMPKAAWITDGEVTFKNDPDSLSSCIDKYTMQCYDEAYCKLAVFPCVNIVKFIQELDATYIVLKMDVESAEYDILPELIKTNAIQKINELYVEYHHQYNPIHIEIRKNIEEAINKMNIKYFNNWP